MRDRVSSAEPGSASAARQMLDAVPVGEPTGTHIPAVPCTAGDEINPYALPRCPSLLSDRGHRGADPERTSDGLYYV